MKSNRPHLKRFTAFTMCMSLIACQSDECVVLCERVSTAINVCQKEWNTEWQYLDAVSLNSFNQGCQDGWNEVSKTLEWRERVEAEVECSSVVDQLQADQITCEDLRMIYFYDPM